MLISLYIDYNTWCFSRLYKKSINNKERIPVSKVEFTKTDAKRFLPGKITEKRHLLDKMGQEFKAELIKIDTAPKY